MFWCFFFPVLICSERKTKENISSDEIVEVLRAGGNFSEIVDSSFLNYFSEFKGNQFLQILNNITVPKRSCYNDILYKMQFDCETANEDQQKTLSLHFTMCYYNITGKLYEFPVGTVDSLKTSQMSPSVYSVYTSMKAHWKNLCLFSKQTVFHEETSHSLIDLYHTIVESMHSIISLQEELNKTTSLLNDSFYNITTSLNRTLENVDKIQLLFESFSGYFEIIRKFIDYAVETIHEIKFFAVVLIIALFFAIYIPKMLIPVSLLTIIFFVANSSLRKRVNNWDTSIYRQVLKILYALTCFLYPTIQVMQFVIILIKSIINSFKKRRQRKARHHSDKNE